MNNNVWIILFKDFTMQTARGDMIEPADYQAGARFFSCVETFTLAELCELYVAGWEVSRLRESLQKKIYESK